MLELNLKIDSIHPCTSSKGGVLYQGWTVKCHDEGHRYLFCFWMTQQLFTDAPKKPDMEELTFTVYTQYVKECGRIGMKIRSVEIHFTVSVSKDLTLWQAEYAYHKWIGEQDLIDHFNPFSLN